MHIDYLYASGGGGGGGGGGGVCIHIDYLHVLKQAHQITLNPRIKNKKGFVSMDNALIFF